MSKTHQLKTDPHVFEDIWQDRKRAEIRYNDRNFEVGDTLRLYETIHSNEQMVMENAPLGYTGREAIRTIAHIQTGYGLPEGYVVLSFAVGGSNIDKPGSETFLGLDSAKWYDLASRHANSDWNSDGYLGTIKTLCSDFLKTVRLSSSLNLDDIDTLRRLVDDTAREGGVSSGHALQLIEKLSNLGVPAALDSKKMAADLLQLDVLLAAFHKAVWDGAHPENPMDYDLAGKDEAKAVQAHVRAMLASRTQEPVKGLRGCAECTDEPECAWHQECQRKKAAASGATDRALDGLDDLIFDMARMDARNDRLRAANRILEKIEDVRASQPEPRPPIEYRYTGGTIWCELGPAEKMRSDFDGVYRLMEGEFPVWRGAIAAEMWQQPPATVISKEWSTNMARQEPVDGQIGAGVPDTAQNAPTSCPHAGPFQYCETCAVWPCPIGLGGKK